MLKAGLRKVESGWGYFSGCYSFQDLLELLLVEPRDADYVSEMSVQCWRPFWPFWEENFESDQYSESRLRALAEAVENTKSIPCEEKEDWLTKIREGNENPVIALLLTRLHCLRRIRIGMNNFPDYFILKTVKRIVKAPGSLSLAQLREVEIDGSGHAHNKWRLATAFAALPSVVSLTACCLVEESPNSAEPSIDVAPQSSAFRDLHIDRCRVSENAVLNMIRNTRSLRSFSYRRPGAEASTYPSFPWIYGALFQHASTSLENLSLRCSSVNKSLDNIECGFQSYTKLRILTIDLRLYLGDRVRTPDMIVDLLPASLEVLTFLRCYIRNHAWFTESVHCMIKSKERKLPRLRILNLEDSALLESGTPLQIRSLRLEALRAGIGLTVEEREVLRRGR